MFLDTANMEVEEERQALSLMVTPLQRETIYGLFCHNNWDIIEADARSPVLPVPTSDEPEDDPEFNIQQAPDAEECPHCLSKPCITDPTNKQLWWEDNSVAENIQNSGLRKGHYKRFWTMLLHRGVWSDPRYQARKRQALQLYANRHRLVWSGNRHRRDLMPNCVITLVRNWLPNPPNTPYMGHTWN